MEQPEPQSPRDSMLKVPDTNPSGTGTDGGPVPHNPLYGYGSATAFLKSNALIIRLIHKENTPG